MSETIQVPLEIQPPQDRPAWANRSLHRVKMGQSAARQELAPQFEENRYSGTPEVRYRPVEPVPEPSSPPQYQPQGVYMENQQQGAPPEFGAIRESLNQPGGPQPLPPDPAQYDFYDPTETARF